MRNAWRIPKYKSVFEGGYQKGRRNWKFLSTANLPLNYIDLSIISAARPTFHTDSLIIFNVCEIYVSERH